MKLAAVSLTIGALCVTACTTQPARDATISQSALDAKLNCYPDQHNIDGECYPPALYVPAQQFAQDEQKADQLRKEEARQKADLDALIEKQNAGEVAERDREAAREKANARKARFAAARSAAQQAAADRTLDSHVGTDCIRTFGRYELDVRDSLGWLQSAEFTALRCSAQHKVLAYLAQFPASQRGERFDQVMDAVRR